MLPQRLQERTLPGFWWLMTFLDLWPCHLVSASLAPLPYPLHLLPLLSLLRAFMMACRATQAIQPSLLTVSSLTYTCKRSFHIRCHPQLRGSVGLSGATIQPTTQGIPRFCGCRRQELVPSQTQGPVGSGVSAACLPGVALSVRWPVNCPGCAALFAGSR